MTLAIPVDVVFNAGLGREDEIHVPEEQDAQRKCHSNRQHKTVSDFKIVHVLCLHLWSQYRPEQHTRSPPERRNWGVAGSTCALQGGYFWDETPSTKKMRMEIKLQQKHPQEKKEAPRGRTRKPEVQSARHRHSPSRGSTGTGKSTGS